MRVFVTGSTGFIGSAIVKDLLSSGHTVLGLSRSSHGVHHLKKEGADALFGTIEDLDVLKQGAAKCDAVIHTAFVHDLSDFSGCCAKDRAAITAMADALVERGGNCALVVTSGSLMLPLGKLGYEDDKADMANPMALRALSEKVCLDYAKRGLRACVVRLPPTVHGPGSSGFLGPLIATALQKGTSAYVGDGCNRWAACHRDDAAVLYRLAIEKAGPASIFHAASEEGVMLKDIAAQIGNQLNLPVVSIVPEEARDHFGLLQFAVTADSITSSEKTRNVLAWEATHESVINDISTVAAFVISNDVGSRSSF